LGRTLYEFNGIDARAWVRDGSETASPGARNWLNLYLRRDLGRVFLLFDRVARAGGRIEFRFVGPQRREAAAAASKLFAIDGSVYTMWEASLGMDAWEKARSQGSRRRDSLKDGEVTRKRAAVKKIRGRTAGP